MKLSFDSQRAQEVTRRVSHAFSLREGILAEQEDLVENQIPQGVKLLSKEHAQFLFYIVPNDHGVKSSRLYARAKELYKLRTSLFSSSEVIRSYSTPEDPDLIESTGRFLGTRYPTETAKCWYLNSQRLENLFSGDPRRLFRSHRVAQELLDEITAFRGYGPKTGGMLLRAAVGLGFTRPIGLEDVLVPVDIHDTRIAFMTGIVSIVDNVVNFDSSPDYYTYVPEVQTVIRDTCKAQGLPWPDVDRALWLIGSRGCVMRRCWSCPLQDLCVVGREVTENTLL